MVNKAQFLNLLFVLSISGFQLFSQVSDSLFNKSCQHEDLIFLSEEMEVNFVGEKIPLMLVNISNDMEIVIQNKNGLKEFQSFELPRNFDESYIYHASAVRNIDWSYDNIIVGHMTASISNYKGKPQIVKINANVTKKRVINNMGFFGFINIYQYSFEDLKVGDTIHISYNYQIALKDNWIRMLSNRMFFNGKYPKKSFKLSWCYNKNLEVDSVFKFLEPPEVTLTGNQLCYYWELENLPGCLDEPAGRPYKSLPHFIFVPKPYDLEYTEYDSYKLVFIPNYFFESSNRQSAFRKEAIDNDIGIKNKNNLNYQKVANKIISISPEDTIGVERMRYFQQFMIDSVSYDNAFLYYNHEKDAIRQRPGVDLYGYKVSDNNIELVYANMLPKLGMNYFTAYPIDIRAGEISAEYNPTVLDNDLIFASILKNNTIGLTIPRSDKNHYYFEELPFYYEGIQVLLLHLADFANPMPNRFFLDNTASVSESQSYDPLVSNFDGGEKRNFNTIFRKWETPSSNYKDNYRKVQSKVSINLDKNTADFKTRVILSGQYSTLTRCVYCKKPSDSTINSKYLEPIWNISDKVKVKNVNPQHPSIFYPFKTTIITDYIANDLIQTKNDQLIIKPASWLKLVYEPICDQQPRFLDYYSDFSGCDSYSYLLEFDKAIQLISSQDTVAISNSYGNFYFLTKQLSANSILLTCNYNIKAAQISKDSIGLVYSINQAIASLDEKEIVVQVFEENKTTDH